jgi:membrane protein required for beta-lactamase induction
VVVLLFSLGPRDLKEEVEDYCAAVGSGALEDTRRLARELVEVGLPEAPDAQPREVERAIYVQANNRVFGVIFWFVLLGPTGAWLFRVMDLMRHRAAQHDAGPALDSTPLIACQALHGVLAWLPARLVAASYALAGSFEAAVSAWRSGREQRPEGFFQATEELLARVGQGARNRAGEDPGSEPRDAAVARAAIGLVTRALWLIWYPVIGLLTLTNWLQ